MNRRSFLSTLVLGAAAGLSLSCKKFLFFSPPCPCLARAETAVYLAYYHHLLRWDSAADAATRYAYATRMARKVRPKIKRLHDRYGCFPVHVTQG
jgi:hypothetical protein